MGPDQAQVIRDDRPVVVEANRAAFEDHAPYDIEHRILRGDGAIRWVHERASWVRSPDGSALAYVSLDTGSGDAASEPIGNALRIRPWDARTATVGAPVELARGAAGVLLPSFSSDGRWIAYGEGTPDPTRLNEVPIGAAAVRTDGSGTTVPLGGKAMEGGGTTVYFGGAGAVSRRKTRIEGGSWSLALVKIAPDGGGPSECTSAGKSSKVLSRIGAATSRPTWPGLGVPSARPTQTPTV